MPAAGQTVGGVHEVDRRRRVSELIRRELSTLIAREVSDERVKMSSITAVTIGKDLKQATVYVSSVDQSASPNEIEKAFNNASKYLRGLLGRQVNLRNTPGLLFKYDHSIRQSMEMSMLIDSLNKKNDSRTD